MFELIKTIKKKEYCIVHVNNISTDRLQNIYHSRIHFTFPFVKIAIVTLSLSEIVLSRYRVKTNLSMYAARAYNYYQT